MKSAWFIMVGLVTAVLAGCGEKASPKANPERPPTKSPEPSTATPPPSGPRRQPIPPDKIKAFQVAGAVAGVHSWRRDVELEFAAESPGKAGVDYLPSIRFDNAHGTKLLVRDAGVPFLLSLHGKGINNDAMKMVARLPSLLGVLMIDTSVTDDGVKEFAGNKNLKYFSVHDTRLTDAALPHLATCTQLEGLVLSDCAITDAGLKKLAGLKELKYLNLRGTGVTEESMPTIAGFTNLTHLSLRGCSVGQKLSPLTKLPRLTHLILHSSTIDDAALRSLNGLNTLEDLDLTSTSVLGPSIKTCAQFPNLTTLAIGSNIIKDGSLKEVKNLANLTSLDIGVSGYTDAGMANLKGSPKLARLNISAAPAVTDKGLAELASIKTLVWINVADTKVTKAGCDAFQNELPKAEISGKPEK
jgi:Leucine-rich repeat (LRR) protein